MKKLSSFLLIFIMLIVPTSIANAQPSCTSGCQTEDCHVVVEQTETMWRMNINCGNGGTVFEGYGQYGGTICGGFTPCQL